VVEQYESLNLALFLRAMSALSYTVILRVNVVKLPCICFECLNDRWTEEMTNFYMHHSLALLTKVFCKMSLTSRFTSYEARPGGQVVIAVVFFKHCLVTRSPV
jgi:hypothetical protein